MVSAGLKPSCHNGLLIGLFFLRCFSLQPAVTRLVGEAGFLLLGWRLGVYETWLALLMSIGIPVVVCFDRPKEPGKGPQSEISWVYFSQSWLQISLFHFLYCDRGMIWYWWIHIHVQNVHIHGWQTAGHCLLRIPRECRDVRIPLHGSYDCDGWCIS